MATEKYPDATIVRLRKLVKEMGPNAASRITGISPQHIANITNGRRRTKAGVPTLATLGLQRVKGLPCPRCSRTMYLVCISGVCAECHILEIVKSGVFQLTAVVGSE